MKKNNFWMVHFAEFFGISVLVFLTHFFIIPVGLALLSADGAIYPIVGDLIRKGHWMTFQLQDTYGGTALSVVRAGWVSLWEYFSSAPFSDLDYQHAHFSFSFLIVPIFIAISYVFLLRSYCSKRAAWIVAIIAAFDFNSRIMMGDSEFIGFYLIFGSLFLSFRARYKNPFTQMSLSGIFIAAVVSGFSVYTSRACLVFVCAFFIPWSWVWNEFLLLIRTPFRHKNIIMTLAFILAFFGLYLEMIGPDMGMIFGRRVKVHATHNFHYAIEILAFIWLFLYWRRIKKTHVLRVVLMGFGFFIGFLPEILFFWRRNGSFPSLMYGSNYSFEESMGVLGKTPRVIFEIIGGGTGFLRNFSALLIIFSVLALIKEARRNRKLDPVIIAGVLAIIAYTRVFTYTIIAPSRYLLPIFPALIVAIGVFLDSLKTRRAWAFTLSLIFLHLGHQVYERVLIIRESKLSGRVEEIRGTVLAFRKAGVDTVISDDFWKSNQYTVGGQHNPFFASPEHLQVVPAEAVEQAMHRSRVGVLLSAEKIQQREVSFFGNRYSLTSMKQIGDRKLFIGQKLN